MNQGMMNTVVAAIVGGVVGAGVVFFASGNKADMKNLELESLKVANLAITNEAVQLNADGKVELFIKDGSVVAEKVIVGNKLMGQQLQGHAFVANRIFVSPDDLAKTPMNEWTFFAEIGASNTTGGEIIVRSFDGPALVGRATERGALMRMGFMPEGGAQVFAFRNYDRIPVPVSLDVSETQRRELSGNTTMPGAVLPPPSNGFGGESTPIAQPQQSGGTF